MSACSGIGTCGFFRCSFCVVTGMACARKERSCRSAMLIVNFFGLALAFFIKSLQLLSANFQAFGKLVYRPCDGASGNCERADGHLDSLDPARLLLHFRTGGKALFG